ncbi:MAG: hypothetical protein Q8S21_05085 [Candidatus Paracaedibacteraceae bacterium]|nr:hypothetical protein [Candidatus Paracaedibacteraceae bacterium]
MLDNLIYVLFDSEKSPPEKSPIEQKTLLVEDDKPANKKAHTH